MHPISGPPQPGLTCNACSISFDHTKEQREHMRESWHVLNVKRRVAELAPVSKVLFDSVFEEHANTKTRNPQYQESSDVPDENSDNDQGRMRDTEDESKLQCLFCSQMMTTLERNLSHMLTEHGFFVPDPESLVDAESFLSYLRILITEAHECLCCGATSSTTEGIRQHMRDKEHCLLNLDAEPELLEFWDFSDTLNEDVSLAAAAFVESTSHIPSFQKLSDTELRLPGGTIVGSRSILSPRHIDRKKRANIRRNKTKTIEDIQAESFVEDSVPAHPAKDRRLVVRGELGMIGVTDQQKRAVMSVEKKIQKEEEVAKASYQWAVEKMVNRQKRYRRIVGKKGCVPMNAHLM